MTHGQSGGQTDASPAQCCPPAVHFLPSLPVFERAVAPHIQSFNTFLDTLLPEIVLSLPPVYVDPEYNPDKHELNWFYQPKQYLKIYVRRVTIGTPVNAETGLPLLPRHCRLTRSSYSAPCHIEVVHELINGSEKVIHSVTKKLGDFPIMVKSNRCSLAGKDVPSLIALREEGYELGGYFIVNGLEKAIRNQFFTTHSISIRCMRRDCSIVTNILIYTEDLQCSFRTLIGRVEVFVPFWVIFKALMQSVPAPWAKQKFLEVDCETPQKVVYMESLWRDFVEDEVGLTEVDQYEDRHLHMMGKFYWKHVRQHLRPGANYEDAAKHVVKHYILVQCETWVEKFEMLLLMFRKLLKLVSQEVTVENVDSLAHQELMTPGQLFAIVLKDALHNLHQRLRSVYQFELRAALQADEDPITVISNVDQFKTILNRWCPDVVHFMNYFMATGNIRNALQMDLQQLTGWTIHADRLNHNRFVSHFRAVHRGQFFAHVRTTQVRKLLGESWGFLCPVHTPDGGPCGLLLHLSQSAELATEAPSPATVAAVKMFFHHRGIAVSFAPDGLTPCLSNSDQSSFPVVVDGTVVCWLPLCDLEYWGQELLALKRSRGCGLKPHVEIVLLPPGSQAYVGIYCFSSPGRILRPLKRLNCDDLEMVGPLEQPHMDIACTPTEVEEAKAATKHGEQLLAKLRKEKLDRVNVVADVRTGLKPGKTKTKALKPKRRLFEIAPAMYTHLELNCNSILSLLAALTPFSAHNQSPRNMYQCQMLKQTMGTPYYAYPHRTDNKTYRLTTPQFPLIQTETYREGDFDEFPLGTNAVVAVISYTGYDMEDAMILNKAFVERGGFHGTVYKTKWVEAGPRSAPLGTRKRYLFHNQTATSNQPVDPRLDVDGFPSVGNALSHDETPLYRSIKLDALSSEMTSKSHGQVHMYNDNEPAYLDHLYLVSPSASAGSKSMFAEVQEQQAALILRTPRSPIVGDKFSSRAGQKGILSALYKHEDMPFTESGIVPDLIFNPHGFPSRMTIGMYIELMAGKAASVHGAFQDSTNFRAYPRQEKTGVPWIDQGGATGWAHRNQSYLSAEEDDAVDHDNPIDYFGKALLRAGYQYYSTEPMYSGVYGNEMRCHIFIGIVYYQRLRHMVSDKWQVRSTGPIDALTRQPIKGRKKGGGVRFGEMERDALIAHGTPFALQDRLLHCSDEHLTHVCPRCGSIFTPTLLSSGPVGSSGLKSRVPECRACQVACRLISLPFVFRYVCNELASMNIRIRLHLSSRNELLA